MITPNVFIELNNSGRLQYSAYLSKVGYIFGGIFPHTDEVESFVFFFFYRSWLGASSAVENLKISFTRVCLDPEMTSNGPMARWLSGSVCVPVCFMFGFQTRSSCKG
jgi:hypothetical protein